MTRSEQETVRRLYELPTDVRNMITDMHEEAFNRKLFDANVANIERLSRYGLRDNHFKIIASNYSFGYEFWDGLVDDISAAYTPPYFSCDRSFTIVTLTSVKHQRPYYCSISTSHTWNIFNVLRNLKWRRRNFWLINGQ
jgi:hypothetical protein